MFILQQTNKQTKVLILFSLNLTTTVAIFMVYFALLSINFSRNLHRFPFYFTNMYPMVLMCFFPLSLPCLASLPHVLVSSGSPPLPNPILELQVPQLFSLSPIIPILAFEKRCLSPTALNPSLLHLICKDPSEPINVFHVVLPREVVRWRPSAIREYSEVPFLLMTKNLTG